MYVVKTDITIYTQSLSASFSSGNPRAQNIYFASDDPDVAEHKIKIRLPHNIMVDGVPAVWYQSVEGLAQLSGFSIIDVSDAHQDQYDSDYMQVTLKASSVGGESKQVRIRIFVLYTGQIVRRR